MVFKAHLIPFILLPLTTATDSPSTSPSKSPSNSPSTSAPTVTPGCYPRWQPHSTYTASQIVSRNVLINATLNLYEEYNYQCREAPLDQYCGQVGYEPGLNGDYGAWNLVWTKISKCEGNAVLDPPTASPTLDVWDGVGCPNIYETGVEYVEGDKVRGTDGNVYGCKPFPYSGSCGQKGFEPGSSSSRWSEAWALLGSCDGTIAPTSSPNYNLVDFGGCPEEYSSSAVYEEGDLVASNGVVFKCRPFPYSAWCSHDAYAPRHTNNTTQNVGTAAWDVLGVCEGTISPTSSPAFDTLADVNGCPGEYDKADVFEGGERVTLLIEQGRGVVYKCADEWPDSGYCNLIPPGHDSQLGWTLQGSCLGTIAPSASPIFVSLPDTSGCPVEYSSLMTYEPGDRVSMYVDSSRAVVWECSQHPTATYCNQFSPVSDTRGGWRKIGSCTGTISPTSSPNFIGLEVGDGCPDDYDATTSYEIGDLVMAVVSQSPLRQMVFMCKSAYCNAGPAYAPGSDNSELGWTLRGHCTGTVAPTSSPVLYSGSCQYNNGTATVDIPSWSKSDLNTYKSGTRVRKGNQIFQCLGYPKYLWCKMSSYEPLVSEYWQDCWMAFGTCS